MAKYFYCMNFHTACETDESTLYAGAINNTISTQRLQGIYSCQWEITVNSSEWNVNKTSINMYLHKAQKMTITLGYAASRDRVFQVEQYTNITSTLTKTISATQSIFISAVPDANEVNTELIFSFNAVGYEVTPDLSY